MAPCSNTTLHFLLNSTPIYRVRLKCNVCKAFGEHRDLSATIQASDTLCASDPGFILPTAKYASKAASAGDVLRSCKGLSALPEEGLKGYRLICQREQ